MMKQLLSPCCSEPLFDHREEDGWVWCAQCWKEFDKEHLYEELLWDHFYASPGFQKLVEEAEADIAAGRTLSLESRWIELAVAEVKGIPCH